MGNNKAGVFLSGVLTKIHEFGIVVERFAEIVAKITSFANNVKIVSPQMVAKKVLIDIAESAIKKIADGQSDESQTDKYSKLVQDAESGISSMIDAVGKLTGHGCDTTSVTGATHEEVNTTE